MRKTACFLSVLSILILIVNAIEAMDKSKVDAKIKGVSSYLERPGGPGSCAKIMFTSLIESILQVGSGTEFPPEFIKSIEKAKQISDSTSVFDPDGVACLKRAYRLINSDHDFQMAGNISGIQDVVNYAKTLLDAARTNLKADNLKECVKSLLDVTMMILTPIQRVDSFMGS